jgi:penicillin V acylase-like amidase (Ntn superfamily)
MCTRILWNSSKVAVMAGRTMDWPESTEPVLTVFPRGQRRHGGLVGGEIVVAVNPLDWTSRFASLVTTIYGVGSADGMNERGFAAHMLYLQSTDLGERDPSRPGLQVGLWVQYLLDGAETVAEGLDLLDTFQPVMFSAHGHAATVHLAMEDAAGDSAIVEFLGGERVVHHGPQFTVLTNEPPYDEQLRLLAEQDYAKPGMDTPVPGNVSAVDRFQRACAAPN